MKLHRLQVEHFGTIREADVSFGPGLNVLHGPNDLGKSSLAEAMRLVLLLPHTSSHGDPYVSWHGSQNPVVELTFQTEPQRYWRVRKQFGKGTSGGSRLQESKDGVSFDDVAKSRQVDGVLREVLGWGIAEPGGPGVGRGLPTSFVSTVLLSTQADVTNLLTNSLSTDGLSTGRERIAAALQAVAQDPLFVKILAETQERRDEAFTDKGSRKTARGSVFKVAADRLLEARKAKEWLEKQVADSADVERDLHALSARRAAAQEALSLATEQLEAIDVLTAGAAARHAAELVVASAQQQINAVRKRALDHVAAGHRVGELEAKQGPTSAALAKADAALAEAEAARGAAEAVVGGADAALAETVQRQQLELRQQQTQARVTAEGQAVAAAEAALALVQRAQTAAEASQTQGQRAATANEAVTQAEQALAEAQVGVGRCDQLDQALEALAAREARDRALAQQAEGQAVAAALAAARSAHATLDQQRSALVVPDDLAPMRKLHHTLAAARGALSVGLVVTVSPATPLELHVSRDGGPVERRPAATPIDLDADAEIEIGIGKVATVRVRGGRREAQARVAELEGRWEREVAPHLVAAGVADLDALDKRLAEAKDLERAVKTQAAAIAAQTQRLATFANHEEQFARASERVDAAMAALGVPLDTLAPLLAGRTPEAAKRQRNQATSALDAARRAAEKARSDALLAHQRTEQCAADAQAAAAARDQSVAAFPAGAAPAKAASLLARAAAERELQEAVAALAGLAEASRNREAHADQRIKDAARAVAEAKATAAAARTALATLQGDHRFAASERDRLAALVAADDLAAAEARVVEANAQLAALPVPSRMVGEAERVKANREGSTAKSALAEAERNQQLTRGRLMQVGGAVAKEKLADAAEAFDRAQQDEQELELEYDAWLLLLDQLKAADAAQASNLGQSLGATLSERFASLTEDRYDRVQLAASLSTDGIVVDNEVHKPERFSVGTREQLSTLYRLALAEVLDSTVVLDDQLVQSDQARMAWFRKLLHHQAKARQIVVLTCRPEDYLDPEATTVDLTRCVKGYR